MTVKRDVTSIEALSGVYVDLDDPRPEMIELSDIAAGLSHAYRFAGQVRRPYSVAQHAVYVCGFVRAQTRDADLALGALHHDSHEAYLGDITSPFKHVLELHAPGLVRKLSEALDRAICERLQVDVDSLYHPLVKDADEYAMRREASALKRSRGVGSHWGYSRPLWPITEFSWSAAEAAQRFVDLHHALIAERGW